MARGGTYINTMSDKNNTSPWSKVLKELHRLSLESMSFHQKLNNMAFSYNLIVLQTRNPPPPKKISDSEKWKPAMPIFQWFIEFEGWW